MCCVKKSFLFIQSQLEALLCSPCCPLLTSTSAQYGCTPRWRHLCLPQVLPMMPQRTRQLNVINAWPLFHRALGDAWGPSQVHLTVLWGTLEEIWANIPLLRQRVNMGLLLKSTAMSSPVPTDWNRNTEGVLRSKDFTVFVKIICTEKRFSIAPLLTDFRQKFYFNWNPHEQFSK